MAARESRLTLNDMRLLRRAASFLVAALIACPAANAGAVAARSVRPARLTLAADASPWLLASARLPTLGPAAVAPDRPALALPARDPARPGRSPLARLPGAAKTAEQAIRDLSAGPPVHRGQLLSRSQYVEIQARRLVAPSLLWVNRAYLLEKGIDVPDGELSPELSRQLLDALAYGVPGRGEPASAFSGQTKMFYADRYGGRGININLGSGRAASAGRIQLKGIGRTPLAKKAAEDHSNGLAGLEEGMREAFWGEVNQILPHGGNRVIALIDRGTLSEPRGGEREPNVIIVREDPVRPAHFVDHPLYRRALRSILWKLNVIGRVDYARRLARSLPVPDGMRRAPLGERIGAGLAVYVDRIAEQHAAAFARRLYHGATSESNIEISGGFLDYATETAMPGHGLLRVLDHQAPAGRTDGFRRILVRNFVMNVLKKAPRSVVKLIPTPEVFLARFDAAYQGAGRREFLRLTGVPAAVSERLAETPEAAALGDAVASVAVDGARKVTGKYAVPDRITRYDLGEILVGLAALRSNDETTVAAWLRSRDVARSESDEPPATAALARAYAAYMSLAVEEAGRRGVGPDAFWNETRDNAAARNRDLPEAYRWKMIAENQALLRRYMTDKDPALIQRAIDERIATARARLGIDQIAQH